MGCGVWGGGVCSAEARMAFERAKLRLLRKWHCNKHEPVLVEGVRGPACQGRGAAATGAPVAQAGEGNANATESDV